MLYNGLERWSAAEDIIEQIRPEPPRFLRAYQPHLRYYLIDEGRYTAEQLSAIDSPLSGLFQVEIASRDRASLQAAVDRLVRLIQADPNKARLDRLITCWLKRHLQRLGAKIDLTQINSLVEDKAMLAENLQHWAEREREEGQKEGQKLGRKAGVEGTLRKLITLKFGDIPETTSKRLEQATDEQLDTWVEQILTANSLDELFMTRR